MRWPPRSTGRPLRDGGGASAGRPARVTGEGRGTLPQTRRENMPPDSAAKQCRQEVTLQNLPSLGSFRCATCRIERRIGGVNGGDASRGRIEGTLRGDASRGRIEGCDHAFRADSSCAITPSRSERDIGTSRRTTRQPHDQPRDPYGNVIDRRGRFPGSLLAGPSSHMHRRSAARAIEPHAPPFSCRGHRATCTAVRHGRRHRVVWVGNVHEPLPGHTSTAPCPSIRSVAEHPTRVRTSSPWPSTRPISEHPARIRTSGPGPPRPLLQEEPHR